MPALYELELRTLVL